MFKPFSFFHRGAYSPKPQASGAGERAGLRQAMRASLEAEDRRVLDDGDLKAMKTLVDRGQAKATGHRRAVHEVPTL